MIYFVVDRVLRATRVRAHRGAGRSVRPGRVRARDEVLDRGRAQHPAAADCRPDPVEPRRSGSASASCFLAAAWLLYRPRTARASSRRFSKRTVEPAAQRARRAGHRASRRRSRDTMPRPSRTQLLALARFDMTAVFRSPAFFVLLGIGFINSIGGLWFANEDLYGNPFYPVTRLMIQTLNGAFTLDPADRRDLLRRRAGLARSRTAAARNGRCDAGARLGVRAAQDPRDHAGAAGDGRGRIVGALSPSRFCRGYTRFELGNYLVWYVLPVDDRRHAARRARGVHSGARAAQVRRLAGDAAVDRVADRARPARLRAQPLSIRRPARTFRCRT